MKLINFYFSYYFIMTLINVIYMFNIWSDYKAVIYIYLSDSNLQVSTNPIFISAVKPTIIQVFNVYALIIIVSKKLFKIITQPTKLQPVMWERKRCSRVTETGNPPHHKHTPAREINCLIQLDALCIHSIRPNINLNWIWIEFVFGYTGM